MTDALIILSDSEIFLYNRAVNPAANNNMGDACLHQSYRDIHEQYLKLYEQSPEAAVKLEALKRLIFLNWYYVLEPVYLNGIDLLDEDNMLLAYRYLDDHIANKTIDDEFTWMLRFYSGWRDLILAVTQNKFSHLTAFLEEADLQVRQHPHKLDMLAMDNRGQMGVYWQSLNYE